MTEIYRIKHPDQRVGRVPQLIFMNDHLATHAEYLIVALQEQIKKGEQVLMNR